MNIRESMAILSTEVKNLNNRMDRLMDLLTPRIEKWDNTTTQLKDLKEELKIEKESLFHPTKLSWFTLAGTIVGHIIEAFKK